MKTRDWEICWVLPKEDVSCCRTLSKTFSLHPVLSKIFVARGVRDVPSVRSFLYPNFGDCLDPFLLPSISAAVERILTARRLNQKVLVYGDNDVDGITSVALLVEFFRLLKMDVDYAFNGVSLKDPFHLMRESRERLADLVITVDWGTTAVKDIQNVRDIGVDVIITDHHEPVGKFPREVPIVNPKLSTEYPNRELTGVGVAFKLAEAVLYQLESCKEISPGSIDIYRFLDLVALGTITDVGELLGENRILVSLGILQIRKGRRLGLRRLLEMVTCPIDRVTASDIALKVAPKLNSLGRLSDPFQGVELLLAIDSIKALHLVKQICEVDRERKEIEKKISLEIDAILRDNPDEKKKAALVLSSDNWHSRIVPIISAKLSKQYNKPVVIVSFSNGVGKGSARTYVNFPLLKVLKKCSDNFLSFGGHNFAAGLSIQEKDFLPFKKKFVHLVQSSIHDKHRKEELLLDARVDFSELTHELLSSIELLEPFGRGNPSPIFFTTARQYRPPKIIAKSHVKLFLESDGWHFEGLGFSMEDRIDELRCAGSKDLRIAYTPRIISSPFLGEVVQLLIRDFVSGS